MKNITCSDGVNCIVFTILLLAAMLQHVLVPHPLQCYADHFFLCTSWASRETCIYRRQNNSFSLPNQPDASIWLWAADQPGDAPSAATQKREVQHNTWPNDETRFCEKKSRCRDSNRWPPQLLRDGVTQNVECPVEFMIFEPKFHEDILQASCKLVLEAILFAVFFVELRCYFFYWNFKSL